MLSRIPLFDRKMTEATEIPELAKLFPLDPGVDTLARIRTLLGEEAAEAFAPLFRTWVTSGFIGGDKFKKAGDDIVKTCVEIGDLQPQHHLLDVGCGIGRIALPLLDFLSPAGAYEGFDVIPSGIDWLRRFVTVKFPYFRFHHADGIHSGLYNPQGGSDPSRFAFPYRQNSFDLAVAVSVFTHMTPPGVSRYLVETGRTLKPGGRLLCTAYLLDREGLAAAQTASSAMSFSHDLGAYRVRNLSTPESAVALDEDYFLADAGKAGLKLAGKIRRGSWRKGGFHTGQDIVVFSAEAAK